MVYFLNWRDSAFFQASFAQRVLLDINASDPSPIVAILLVLVVVPVEFVVLLLRQLLMLFTLLLIG